MLKCQISLDAFAWELDEKLVDNGKTLFANDHLTDLDNIGQGVWTMQVDDGGESYEVEILLKSRVFRRVGCECATFAAGQICVHMVVGFYAILERLPKKALRNKPVYSVPLAKRKVRDFLEMIPEDRMEDLVVNWAKKNRRFALLIRAGATPYAQGEPEKYKQLLFLVIKYAATQQKISVSGLNLINEVVITVIGELKRLLNDGDTTEIRLFVDQYLRAWTIVKNYSLPDTKKAHTSLLQSLQLLEQAVTIIVAPELIEEIAVMLARHVPIYARLSQPVLDKLLTILRNMAKDADVQAKCAHEMEPILESDVPFVTIQDILKLLAEWGSPVELAIKPVSPFWSEVECQHYCQLAIESGHFELLAALVQILEKRSVSLSLAQNMEDYKLLVARSEGDEDRLVLLAENNFKQTGQIKYYKILKEHFGKAWPKEAPRLHDFFVKNKKPLPAALMLVDLKDWNALLSLAEAEADLLFLPKVDKYLFVHKPKRISELYLELMEAYFDQHLGERPVDVFVYLQEHLEKIGHASFGKELKKWMRKRYGHRPLLKTVF